MPRSKNLNALVKKLEKELKAAKAEVKNVKSDAIAKADAKVEAAYAKGFQTAMKLVEAKEKAAAKAVKAFEKAIEAESKKLAKTKSKKKKVVKAAKSKAKTETKTKAKTKVKAKPTTTKRGRPGKAKVQKETAAPEVMVEAVAELAEAA